MLLTAIVVGCGEDKGKEKLPVNDIVENPEKINEHVKDALASIMARADTAHLLVVSGDSLKATRFFLDTYSQRSYQQLFSDKGMLTPVGDTLLSILHKAGDYGLIPSDYHTVDIDSLYKTSRDKDGNTDAVKLANADVLLSDAFFLFAVHLSKGRMNDSLRLEWHPERVDTNLALLFTDALKNNSFRKIFDSLEPKQVEYKNLKHALKHYRLLFEGKTWDTLPTVVPDTNVFKELLKKRLLASYDYDSTLTVHDSVKLFRAIKSFQLKHGLNNDGKLGKNTIKAMNISPQQRIKQLEINMERWRWEPNEMPGRYAWINIPSFFFHVMEADTLVMDSRVIVGTPKNQTPVQVGKIRYFLLYPYWRVPYSIAWKEILPAVQRDTSYLRKHNFEVLDWNNQVVDATTIKWKKYSKNHLPYTFRQREGEDNSLGVMKFNFENKYGVYLHDTNSKRLFGKETRALSHGCMRLEEYMDFANFLIRDDSVHYRADSLLLYLEKRERKQINLRKPINIHVKYFTCQAEHGRIFYADVYGKDEKMIRLLYKK